jgi:hypothetical protein
MASWGPGSAPRRFRFWEAPPKAIGRVFAVIYCYYKGMPRPSPLAAAIRTRPGEIVGVTSFPGIPKPAVAQGLARMARKGKLTRIRKGLYYVPKHSRFGPVPPDRINVTLSAMGENRLATGGASAANTLGFSTQLPLGRADVISTQSHRIRRTALEGVRILSRSPERRHLTVDENAFLEVLRNPDDLIELSTEAAIARALDLISTGQINIPRITRSLPYEPPRVRAIVGAIGEAAGLPTEQLASIRELVNPVSRFHFGLFSALPSARNWGVNR